MQKLNIEILKTARKEKMQKLEKEMQEVIIAEGTGHLFICPFCNYSSSKNSKGSAKCFDDDGIIFKCFHCGIWRSV